MNDPIKRLFVGGSCHGRIMAVCSDYMAMPVSDGKGRYNREDYKSQGVVSKSGRTKVMLFSQVSIHDPDLPWLIADAAMLACELTFEGGR